MSGSSANEIFKTATRIYKIGRPHKYNEYHRNVREVLQVESTVDDVSDYQENGQK
jgi:hypothetical protein